MPKCPKEIHTGNGNQALNNLDLYRHIRDYEFPDLPNKNKTNKAQSKLKLKAVLFTLATYRNNVTAQCNPDQRTIAENCGCSKDTVRRSINELVERGFIVIINLAPTGSNTRNRYYFRYDMTDLKSMFDDYDHELHKTNECDYIEEAIDSIRKKFPRDLS